MDVIASLHSMLPAESAAPEWVQLVPAGAFSGADGRGPYQLDDPDGVIRASLAPKQRLVFDQDHATDHSLKSGIQAPARGWITELQARQGAIWGRVEWTEQGRKLLEAGSIAASRRCSATTRRAAGSPGSCAPR